MYLPGDTNTNITQALLGGKTGADRITKRVLGELMETDGGLCFLSAREGVSPKNAKGRWDKSIVNSLPRENNAEIVLKHSLTTVKELARWRR